MSGGGTNLQALIDAQKNGEIGNGSISLVIASKPDVYALTRASDNGIESKVLARKEYESIADYSKALVDALQGANIDLVVLAGFLAILGKDFIDAYRDKIVNIHPALLPKHGGKDFLTIFDEQVYNAFPNRILNVHPALIPSFCGKGYYGLHVHEAALEKGVKVSGATVHIVTPECDAGPIVLQKAVEVLQDDTPEALQKRIMEQAEWKILPEAVKLFCDGKIIVENNRVTIKGE